MLKYQKRKEDKLIQKTEFILQINQKASES